MQVCVIGPPTDLELAADGLGLLGGLASLLAGWCHVLKQVIDEIFPADTQQLDTTPSSNKTL